MSEPSLRPPLGPRPTHDASTVWQLATPIGAAPRAVGRIAGGWAYEMQLERQNGCWVVSQLRVFPDPGDDLDLERLLDQTKFWMEVGMADWAADWARELARFARARPQQQVAAHVPVGGLTARGLRRIPFGKVNRVHTAAGRVWPRMAKSLRRSYDRQNRLGRGDVRLARIARLYVQALEGRSRTPTVDVARQVRMKDSQVRDATHLARRRGLLSATRKQGRPGGELTAKAVELLKSAEGEAARLTMKGRSESKGQPSGKATSDRPKGR